MSDSARPQDPHVPYDALARYLDGSIESDERADIDRHLAECEACRRDVQDARDWQQQLAVAEKPDSRKMAWVFIAVGVLGLCVVAGLIYYYLWPA